jgi:hypothetical protein
VAIVVVGGTSKDIGKTALVCAIIAALREFSWTAVKITGHDYESPSAEAGVAASPKRTIREEGIPGTATDTARYLAAGARRALLVTRHGSNLPIEEIRQALGSDRNIIFESNRIVDVLRPDLCIALIGGGSREPKESFKRLLAVADLLVKTADSPAEMKDLPGVPQFHLHSLDRLSPQMADWLRARLHAQPQPEKT